MQGRTKKKPVVAFIGNPNVGKTELFNRFTGLKQHVGNWPGVTVEKKVGECKYHGVEFELVDLPGIYSLTPYAIDELIARNFIVEEKPDVVVDIINATNLERNLYLTLLLMEAEANVVIALNMWDIASKKGIKIDIKKLQELLGIPVVPTVAVTGEGIEKLKEEIVKAIKKRNRGIIYSYGKDIERRIDKIKKEIAKDEELVRKYPIRWLAIKILERDEKVMEIVSKSKYADEIIKAAGNDEMDTLLAEKRYEIISRIVKEVTKNDEQPWSFTDMLDHVFLHPVLGIPIFLAMLYAIFQFTFAFSAPFSDMINLFFEWLGDIASSIPNPMIASMLSDGVFAGVGSVLTFVPPIFSMFFALALLEDSGYLARAAFVMDRVMSKVGLHGKSFLPMIMGFGCNIPGILASRSIENKEDRIITVMINPLMSCSARLPVYVLIAGTVFSGAVAGAAVFSMYLLGVALAVFMAVLLRKLLFKGKPSLFILEMPNYVMPSIRKAAIHMWENGKWFIVKAGTFIFVVVLIVWAISVFPWDATDGGRIIENSYAAMFGRAVEPVFKPFGWPWQAGTALFFGFLAKEAIVGTFGAFLGSGGIRYALQNAGWFTPLTGFAYMAFVLIYFPCAATLAVMLREIKLKYTMITVAYTITLAFTVAAIIEFVGHLLGYT
ncbi:MAG: ferrous iron transport protein B [Thermoplasmata archaeon]|nr:ferrous iron transport protein B [Thermoplasmata archaeon]